MPSELMIRVARVFLVDGVEVNLSTEAGSAAEALAAITEAADELGAAPGPVESTETKAKRGRRTKAEMAEIRAKEGNGPVEPLPPTLPAGVATAFPGMTLPPAPTQPDLPFNGPSATMTDKPPVQLGHSEVSMPPAPFTAPPSAPSFTMPPPPVAEPQFSPEEMVLEQIRIATLNLINSVPPAWRPSATANIEKMTNEYGPNKEAFNIKQLEALLKSIGAYQEICNKAPR